MTDASGLRSRWEGWVKRTLGGSETQVADATSAAMEAIEKGASQEDVVRAARAAWASGEARTGTLTSRERAVEQTLTAGGSLSAQPAPLATISQRPPSAIYDYLRQDPTPLSRQTVAAIDRLEMRVHPKFSAYVGRASFRFVLLTVLTLGTAAVLGYIRARTTTISLAQGRLQIRKGILSRRLDNVDLWHVREITLERTFVNRLTGDGTLVLRLQQPGSALELVGLARGKQLEETYQELLNVVFLLRSSPAVKGFIQ